MSNKKRRHTKKNTPVRKSATPNPEYKGKFHNGKKSIIGFKKSKVEWYWDVRLWSPLIIIAIIVSLCINPKPEVEPIPIQEPGVEEVQAKVEETIPEPTMDLRTTEIAALARLADTVAHGKSDEVKSIIMWIVINRVEDRANGYGLDLQGEIARPKQWQCYDPNGTYLESTFVLASNIYDTWMSGGPRPIYDDMLWFVFNKDGSITVRNRFGNEKNRSEATFGQ